MSTTEALELIARGTDEILIVERLLGEVRA